MAKDRARPFSPKHRRYWIPVLGGMILIGLINLAIGFGSYNEAPHVQDIELHIPVRDAPPPQDAPGTIGASELPAVVMRAFAIKYPRTIPTGAHKDGDTFTIDFPAGAPHHHATYRADGTWVSED